MQITSGGTAQRYTVLIQGDRRAVLSGLNIHVLVISAVISYYGNDWPLWLRIAIAVLGLLWLVVDVLQRWLGRCELVAEAERFSIRRTILGIERTRVFPRADVEKMGYSKDVNVYKWGKIDSALTLLVRQDVTPMLLAKGVRVEEAERLFDDIAKSDCWLKNILVPVGAVAY